MSSGAQIGPQAWLAARMREGNWLDVAPDEDIHPEIVGWNRTLVHMHQLAFAPEVRRRSEAGSLPENFKIWAAQRMQPRGGDPFVRFNEEVRGVPYLRTNRSVKKGDKISLSDFSNLEVFDLHDDELDSGHFTIFWTGKAWVGSFDFRAGRAKCLALIEKALIFVAATRLSVTNHLAEPAVDSLFTACELLAKARLILLHQPADRWKSHGRVASEINRFGQLGNVDIAFLEAFNRLSQIRNHAKYATGFNAEPPGSEEIELIAAMAVGLKESIGPKRPLTVPAESP